MLITFWLPLCWRSGSVSLFRHYVLYDLSFTFLCPQLAVYSLFFHSHLFSVCRLFSCNQSHPSLVLYILFLSRRSLVLHYWSQRHKLQSPLSSLYRSPCIPWVSVSCVAKSAFFFCHFNKQVDFFQDPHICLHTGSKTSRDHDNKT